MMILKLKVFVVLDYSSHFLSIRRETEMPLI